MSFFEDISAALDSEGIESRVDQDVLCVPTASGVSVQFVETDEELPAASVYIAPMDPEGEGDRAPSLVSVVFSAESAVETVRRYLAVDHMVDIMNELLDGSDDRLAELDFERDGPLSLVAPVGDLAELQVEIDLDGDAPGAGVDFVVCPQEAIDRLEEVYERLAGASGIAPGSDEDASMRREFLDTRAEAVEERLELGWFTDLDRLLDVLAFAADQASAWEVELSAEDGDYEGILDLGLDFFAEQNDPGGAARDHFDGEA